MNIERLPQVKGYVAPPLTLFEAKIDESWPREMFDVRIAAFAWLASVIMRHNGQVTTPKETTLQLLVDQLLRSNIERRTCSFSVNMELRELFEHHGLAA